MARLNPTTKVQISGHKFLKRRVAHGLVFGDIRMIHDPLGRRRRAMLFGGAASVLIAVAAGAMALFAPDANPGDVPILRASGGQLYARLDGRYHPVPNLTSARLLAGEAAEAKSISDTQLAALPKGHPVGIVDAPGVYEQRSSDAPRAWLACHTSGVSSSRATPAEDKVTVVAAAEEFKEDPSGAVFARAGGREFVVTADGRYQLPLADTPEGRTWRRGLGITPQTPVWTPPADVLSLLNEHPLEAPPADAAVWVAGERAWLKRPDGVAALTHGQAEALVAAGVSRVEVTEARLGGEPDSPAPVSVPDTSSGFIDPSDKPLCVDADGTLGVQKTEREAQALAGESVATHFLGGGAAMLVDTGSGLHVVSESGRRHALGAGAGDAETAMVGAGTPQQVDWLLLRLLPEGTPLTFDEAARPIDADES